MVVPNTIEIPAGAIPAQDIFAATRVVSLIPGDGTDLTIAAAIAALPAAGGSIYIKQGVYPLAATLALPDKPIKFIGSGRSATILDLGAVAIPAFTLPFNNRYTFEDFTIRGTSLAGQWGFAYGGGIVSPKTQRCLRVRTESIEKVVKVTAGSTVFSFAFCELETSALATAAFVDATIGSALVQAVDTNMGAEGGSAGGFFGSVEPQFLRCTVQCFNGVMFTGGANPILTNCHFFGIATPIDIAIGGFRIIGCRFTVSLPGVTALLLSSGRAIVSGCDFSVPVGAITISIPSNFNIIADNTNCRVLESGTANSNRYLNNTLFVGSTIIGPDSFVNGMKKKGVTAGVTTGVFVDQFTHENPKGVGSYGTVKNTGGVNSMEVRETGTDAFGVTTALTTVVAPGGALVLISSFIGIGGVAFPPLVSYTIAVRHPVAATTFDLQFTGQGTL